MCYSTKIQTFCELNTAWVSLTILLQHNAFFWFVMPSGWISDYNILLVSSPFSSGVPVSSSILCPFGHAFIYLCAFIFFIFYFTAYSRKKCSDNGSTNTGELYMLMSATLSWGAPLSSCQPANVKCNVDYLQQRRLEREGSQTKRMKDWRAHNA